MNTTSFLEALRAAFDDDAVLEEASELAGYEQGWRYGQGKARAVVKPSSTRQVSTVLQLSHSFGVRTQVIGANTGLVGASNPDSTGDQVVLSMERLNQCIEVDAVDRTVVVDAGVLLSQLNAALEPYGLWFPVDLGADPQIGGMIATNTGGTRLLHYGDVRHNLLGLEVVLADGTTVDCLKRLRKDNTGLDYKQIFVGTSGTYGVVTRAVLQVVPRPTQTATVMVGVRSGNTALQLLRDLEHEVGDLLTVYEAVSRPALAATLQHGANVRNPFAEGLPEYALLIELASSLPRTCLDLDPLLQQALMDIWEQEGSSEITEVLVGRPDDFWAIRHQVSESLRADGKVLAFDLAVPRSRLADFTEQVRQSLQQDLPFIRVCDFGHWGDGGTHLNLVWDPDRVKDEGELWQELQSRIYELCVHQFAGSYSAEHGVGPHNQRFYNQFTPEPVRLMCRQLKQLLDPKRRLGTVELD